MPIKEIWSLLPRRAQEVIRAFREGLAVAALVTFLFVMGYLAWMGWHNH